MCWSLCKDLPKRWEMVVLIFSGLAMVYILRVNISVAAQNMRDELDWSENQKGLVLSSFYWGYALGQIPASRLVQMYGAKWVFGLSVLVPSALTLLVPVACKSSFGLALFIRAIIAVFHFFPLWIPLKEKTFLIPAIVSGMYMGEILGFSLSGAIVHYCSWEAVFYIFGAAGVVWFPLWALLAYDRPEDHPHISDEELKLIKEDKHLLHLSNTPEVVEAVSNPLGRPSEGNMELGSVLSKDENSKDASYNPNDLFDVVYADEQRAQSAELNKGSDLARRVPWKAFFTNPYSLTLFLNGWTFGFIGFTALSEMPSFLNDQLGFSLYTTGILCVFPYAALFASTLLFGKGFNHLQQQYGYSTDSVRQMAQFLSFGGSAFFLIIVGYLQDTRYACYIFLIISQAFLGATQSGMACSFSDISPTFSSALNSVGNTMAAIAGIMGPIVVSLCLDEHPGIYGWRIAFFLTAFFAVIALAFWSHFQTSKVIAVLNTPTEVNEDSSCLDPLMKKLNS